MSSIENNFQQEQQIKGDFNDIKKTENVDLSKGENEVKPVEHAPEVLVGMRSDKQIKKQHEEILHPKEQEINKESLEKDLPKKDLPLEKESSLEKELPKKEAKISEKDLPKKELSLEKEAKISDKDIIRRDIEASANKKEDSELKSDSEIKKEGEVHESESILDKAKDIAIDAKDAIVEGAAVVGESIKDAYEKTIEFFKSN